MGFNYGSKAQCIADYKGFNAFLGAQESEMLSVLNHSFDTILQSIYPEANDLQDRIFYFLEGMDEHSGFPSRFFSDSSNFHSLKTQLEYSGFRKEIYIYEEEDYTSKFDLNDFVPIRDEPETYQLGTLDLDLIEAEIRAEREVEGYDLQEYNQELINPFDDRPELGFYMNPNGKFWYGLGKYSCNEEIIGILEAVNNQNNISLGVVAGGMKGTDLNDPFIRQAIIAQFYIPAILRFGYSDKPK